MKVFLFWRRGFRALFLFLAIIVIAEGFNRALSAWVPRDLQHEVGFVLVILLGPFVCGGIASLFYPETLTSSPDRRS